MKIENIIIDQFLNQAESELIGAVWTDKKGKIHVVGLIEKNGQIMPDLPYEYAGDILDVAQIGMIR